jgi:hypothetical protein
MPCAASNISHSPRSVPQVNDTADAQTVSVDNIVSLAPLTEEQQRILWHDGEDGKWNDKGWSALMHAADTRSLDLGWLLLRAGARLDTRSAHGLTAADIAAQHAAQGDAAAEEMVTILSDVWLAVPLSELHALLAARTSSAFKAKMRTSLLAMHRATGGRADRNVADTLARDREGQ